MKKSILLLFAIFSVGISNAQSYKLPMSEVNVYLDLMKDNSYIIKYSNNLEKDIMLSQFFSYGKFTKQKDKLILTDAIQVYKMEFDIKAQHLVLNKGFNWLKKGKFKKISEVSSTPLAVMKAFPTFADTEEIRTIWNKKGIKNDCFSEGKFEAVSDSDYKITLQRNNKYDVKYHDQILSQGDWKIENNWIILKDSFVENPYMLFINDADEIRSCFVPGDFTTLKFKRVK